MPSTIAALTAAATGPIHHEPSALLAGQVGIAVATMASFYILIAGSLHLWSLRKWALIASDRFARLPGVGASDSHTANETSPLIHGGADPEDVSGDAEDTAKLNLYRRTHFATAMRWTGVALALVSLIAAVFSVIFRVSVYWQGRDNLYIVELWTGSLWVLALTYSLVLYFLAAFVTSVDAPRFSSGLFTFTSAAFLASSLQVFKYYSEDPWTRLLWVLEATIAVPSLLILMTHFLLKSDDDAWTLAVDRLSGRDKRKLSDETTGEASASLFSLMFFNWVNPLLELGSQRPLTADDLWNLKYCDRSSTAVARFNKVKEGRSLIWAMLVTVRRNFFMQNVFAFFISFLIFAMPFFFNRIISWLQDPADSNPMLGWYYLISLFFCSVLKGVFDGQQYFLGRRVGLQIRAILVSEIYAKSLRRAAGMAPAAAPKLAVVDETVGADDVAADVKDDDTKSVKSVKSDKDAASKKDEKKEEKKDEEDASIGKIVTIMSVDSERIREFMCYAHRTLIQTPLTAIFSIVGLVLVLGPSALVGLTVILISGPASGVVGSWLNKVQDELMSSMDKRVNITNEVLSGIRIIKYFAWERHFESKIQEARKVEIWNLVRISIVWVVFGLVSFGSSLFVSFTTFAFYTLVAGHTLDPSTAFTSLILLHQVAEIMGFLPYEIMTIFQAKVSLDRITGFLAEQELDSFDETAGDVADPDPENKPTVGFRFGRFTYFTSEKKDKKDNKEKKGKATTAPDSTTPLLSPAGSIASDISSASQSGASGFTLRELDVDFKWGGLNVVSGATGSGKSSICLALLGELKRLGGKAYLSAPGKPNERPSVAYVAQTSWLLNASVRENILMGSPFDAARYNAVIEACALVRDLETLEGGDLTEIGEKGVNVSGGQKQRISLARAVYSSANILVLDDPLSAVDAPTARHLVLNALLGPLVKGRTVILVSHAVSLVLPVCDHVIVMQNGMVVAQGTPAEVADNPNAVEITHKTLSSSQLLDEASLNEAEAATDQGKDKKKKETKDMVADASKATKLVGDEENSTGSVATKVYLAYFASSGGPIFVISFLLTYAIVYGVQFFNDYWLKLWSDASSAGGNNGTETMIFAAGGMNVEGLGHGAGYTGMTGISGGREVIGASSGVRDRMARTMTLDLESGTTMHYVVVYGLVGLCIMLAHNIQNLVMTIGSLLASRRIHDNLLRTVLGAPMRFFEITPIGRILNRFSKDLSAVDSDVMRSISFFLDRVCAAIGIFVVISSVVPVFIIAIPPIVLIYRSVARLYLNASRELKRLEAVSRSPVYSQFSETLTGASTIRAYGQSKRFITQNQEKLDKNHRAFYLLWAANRWLCLRTDLISAFVVFLSGSAVFLAGHALNPGWAGVILLYAGQFNDALLWLIRMHAEMEMSMNSVERCMEYSAIEQEPAAVVPAYRPAPEWPSSGEVEVQDLSVRYAPDQPFVLKQLNFTTRPGEKIGVVGRTGAGKSTLSLAFFRIIPFAEGTITIDGMDIGRMGLEDLRSRLTIIPQDPILFTGTIRSNLDPLGEHNDADLWRVLRSTHVLDSLQRSSSSASLNDLAGLGVGSESAGAVTDQPVASSSSSVSISSVSNSDFSLDSAVSENGQNFSQGQRQLICMARALLRRSKLVFLDEATASIDASTDARIQATIRDELKDATVFTIAHRLKTVVDYDRILVLDMGKVIEYGSPIDLIERSPIGHFRKMCEDTGEMDELVEIAKESAAAAAKKRGAQKALPPFLSPLRNLIEGERRQRTVSVDREYLDSELQEDFINVEVELDIDITEAFEEPEIEADAMDHAEGCVATLPPSTLQASTPGTAPSAAAGAPPPAPPPRLPSVLPRACIFIANLNAGKTDDELLTGVRELFNQWGPTLNVKVQRDGKGRPFGFVQYVNIADAKKALQSSPGAVVDGRQIRVEPANVIRTLFITKIGIHMDQSDVTHIAERFGPVEDVTLLRFPDTGKSRGCGFIKYFSREDAIRAMAGMRKIKNWIVEWSTRVDTIDPNYIDPTSIFIGKINRDVVTHEKLIERFGRYGTIAQAKLVMPSVNPPGTDDYLNGGLRNAFAFITYEVPGSAELATDGENGTEWLGRIIKVELREINRRMRSAQASPGDGTIIPVNNLLPSQVFPLPTHANMNGYYPNQFSPHGSQQRHVPHNFNHYQYQHNPQQPQIHAAILPGTHQPQSATHFPSVTSPNVSQPAATVASAAFAMKPPAAQPSHPNQPHHHQLQHHGVNPSTQPPAGLNYFPMPYMRPDPAYHPHHPTVTRPHDNPRNPVVRPDAGYASQLLMAPPTYHHHHHHPGAVYAPPQGMMVQTQHGPMFVMCATVFPPGQAQHQGGIAGEGVGGGGNRQDWGAWAREVEVGRIEEVVDHNGV
ncbi:hypothetical protein HK101_006256 [Irineochytrium annulatum]|nr:hypothetical protein HK101_006256 [Irineochytrium annulatum]